MRPLDPDKSMLGYEVMASCPDIFCFVTTRHGGYSKGNYASFNCTPYVGDNDECVRRNQEKLLSLMPQQPHTLVIPYQTHGTESIVIDSTYLDTDDNERHALLQGIDSLITREPGCCLCISTADCIPILLHDSKNGVVAAVHAGWRGTVNRILARTLQRMYDLYGTTGKNVRACIGPGISLPAFEVGEEVYEAFRENGFPTDCIAEWKPATHKHHIDLWAANRMQLTDFGIPDGQIESSGICTYTRHEDFFSARRLGIRSGRILSGIMKLNAHN